MKLVEIAFSSTVGFQLEHLVTALTKDFPLQIESTGTMESFRLLKVGPYHLMSQLRHLSYFKQSEFHLEIKFISFFKQHIPKMRCATTNLVSSFKYKDVKIK